jgi:hypothetical protein
LELQLIFNQAGTKESGGGGINISAITNTNNNSFIASESEPILSFYLTEINAKRKLLLDNNIIKFSVMVIQRIYRGHLGRKRFSLIYQNYLVMKRKRYLSYKVFYRLLDMYERHNAAAVEIQKVMKGFLLRKQVRLWNLVVLKVQCRYRIFRAKKRMEEERMRQFDGPQVVSMIRGGRMIEIQNQMCQLFIYRCGNQYKFYAINIVSNKHYYGYCYERELKKILALYNSHIIEALDDDATSLYSKQLQIQLWQYEKLLEFFVRYINLLPKIYNITNNFNNAKAEEISFYLAICYEKKYNHFLHMNHRSNKSIFAQSTAADATATATGTGTVASDDSHAPPPINWNHNHGNVYRNKTKIILPTAYKLGGSEGVGPGLGRSGLSAITMNDDLHESYQDVKLQKDMPKDLIQHPIIDTIKKMQMFSEYNRNRRKRKPNPLLSSLSTKSVGSATAASSKARK